MSVIISTFCVQLFVCCECDVIMRARCSCVVRVMCAEREKAFSTEMMKLYFARNVDHSAWPCMLLAAVSLKHDGTAETDGTGAGGATGQTSPPVSRLFGHPDCFRLTGWLECRTSAIAG